MLRHLGKHPDVYAIPKETQPHPARVEEWLAKHLDSAIDKAGKKGASCVVEKSPMNALYAVDLLHRVEKATGLQCRYIHMSRDTHKTLESMERFGGKPWPHTGRVPGSMGHEWSDWWREETRLFVEWVNFRGMVWAKYDERCLCVYFDLVVNRPELMQMVTNHIGARWDKEWLECLEFKHCKTAECGG